MKTIKLTENQIYIIKKALDDYYESNDTTIDGSNPPGLNEILRSEQRIIKNIYKKL